MIQDDSMFHYNFEELKKLLSDVLRKNVSPETFLWLNEKASSPESNIPQFNAAFAAIPRKTGRSPVQLNNEIAEKIQAARPGVTLQNWTTDRLARVWLLMQLDASDKEKYFSIIENLFPTAEVNELVALYSSLPVLAYPEIWKARCSEGIRNNIGDVLTAVMCNNAYPSESLDEPAWNQLVLKAFFTGKPVDQIIGLDKRANEKLANTLSDYAHERWAANRPVNPQLWRCVGPLLNERLLPDIEKVAASENQIDQEAAALACYDSRYQEAKKLIPEHLRKKIETGELSWKKLAEKIKDYVLQ